jgi:hypothetical protein
LPESTIEDLRSDKSQVVNPRILLTDTNRAPFAARLAIALSKSGCDVAAVCPTRGQPLFKTRAVQRLFAYSGVRPLESLTAAIEATMPSIVVPCDDRGVQHLHELHARSHSLGSTGLDIRALVERSLGSPQTYATVSARYSLLVLAAEEGIRIPDTKLLESADDLRSWQQGRAFPWVLKADGTFGGRGVRITHSLPEAQREFSELARPHRATKAIKRLIVNRDSFWLRPWWNGLVQDVIVQCYIQGRPANCAVVCWEGKVLAGIGVEVVSADGLTGPASVVRLVDNREMMVAAERIAYRLGLSGFFGLDFMIEHGTSSAFLIEMNPRSTPLCHLQLGPGRDLPGALWAKLSGQPVREMPAVTQNDLIAYFPQAWTRKSEFLQSSFQDVPLGEPDLIQELLDPWPDRSLLYRLVSKANDFAIALANRRAPNEHLPDSLGR